jgi:hypothetical protein
MKTRAISPVLVVAAVVATGLWLQGATPSVPTGQWQTGAALGQPRTGAVPVMLDDGRVLLVGGRAAGAPVAAVDVVNPDGSIAAGIPLSVPRAGHTAVRLADGSVLVAGGTTLVASDQGTVEAATATAEVLYAGATQWIAATGLTQARTGATATSLPDGRVLVAGGADDNGPLDTFEIYDPISTTFHPGGLLSAARAGHAAAVAGKASVLVAGGHNASGAIGTADIIDADTGGVVTVTMTAARDGASATALLDGRVLVAGGWDGANDLATAEVIDPASATTTATLPMGSRRRNPQALLLDHNATVLITGGTNAGAVVPTAEHFVVWENGFRPAANNPAVSRTGALTSALAAEGVALLAAGQAADSSLVAPTELYGFATLHTDKDDYEPGTFVTITGSGWQPGETVNMVLHETGPTADPDFPLNAVADANGNITNDAWAPNEGDLGRRFYLTANGSASTAQLTFADSRMINSVLLNGSTSVTVVSGASISAALNVTTDNGGGNQNWRSTSWLIANAPPGGTTCVDSTNHDGSGTYTDTISITAPAAPGTYNAYFLAHRDDTCTTAQQSNLFTLSSGVTVVKADTTTTITSDTPDPSTIGQAVTINYSVAVVAPGSGIPTGNVTVTDGTQSCTGTVAAGTCSIAFASGGAKSLTATYAGDTNFNGSASTPPTAHTVNKLDTTTAITNDTPDPSVVGQLVTVSYTVTSTSGTPTGNVTVSDGTDSCTASVATGTCNITFTSAGAKSLTATYAGDTTYNGSASTPPTAHTVNKANMTTSITSDTPDPSVVGQSVAVAYSVTVNSPGSGTPTGNVTVSDGTQSCTGTVAAGSCSITFTSAGAKSLTATYAGDTNFNGSTSASESHTVNKANTTTTITSHTPDSSVVGQPVAVAYSVTVNSPGSGSPTGNVTISDGTQSCTGTIAAGTCSIASTTAGAKSLTATYAGDGNFNGSASTPVTPHQVNKADTTTAITSDTPDPSKVGQAVTVNFSVTVNAPGSGTPTGNVTVSDGTDSCTGTVVAGTCSITLTTAGARSLTATYAGDTNFNTSTSTPSTPHTVDKADTTTTITADTPDPSVVGQPVPVAYTVTVNSPGTGVPTGNVTVSDGTDSCVGTAAAGTCNLTFTSAGTKTLTATYAGDTNFNGSTSASESHLVNKADTTTTITADTPDPSVVGQPVPVAYSVTVNSPGTGVPTGNVTVSDGTDSCVGTVAAGTCNLTFTSAGAKSLTASYAGDANFNGSTSAAEGHQVNKANTTTSITSDTPEPSTVGQLVAVAYDVTVNAPGSGTPTGNVTVSDGTQSCTGTVAAGSCSITFTTAGAKSLTATYVGDGNFNGSTSASESHTVSKANTATTITADTPDPSVVGQPVPVAYNVTVNSPGTGTPTGNVTVSDGTVSCTGTVAAGTCNLTFTSAGAKTLTATYVGDANFNGSTSASESHTVNKANTTTTITADTPDPSVVGQPVPVTFSVTADAPGSGTPTGNVTVSDGTDSCVGTVAAGSCNLTFTSTGAKTLTATYAGDSNFIGSTSASESHTVSKANTTATITADTPDPSVVGQPVPVTFSVTVNAPGSGTPTGNVTVSDGTDSCIGTVAAGTCNLTFTSAGAKSVTATYAGDGNFNGSTSATESHQVNKAATTTVITNDAPDPSVLNSPYAVSWSVTVNSPGAGSPTGTVTVSDGSATCSAAVAAGGCPLTSTTPGAKSLTATFTGDSNFQGSSGSTTHNVQYVFSGFFAPVDNAPVVNKANAGQAIPVKWRLTDTNGVGISDPSSFTSLTAYTIACNAWASLPTDPALLDQVSTSGLLYQGNGNWQYNWKTPKQYANMCMVARVTLSDGTTHEFNVSFK